VKIAKPAVAAPIAAIALLAAPLAAAQEPYEKPDDTWIRIGGTVGSVDQDSFMLDYGEGLIEVEMDDGDRDADAYKLLEGDKVTVNGRIDDDLYETTSIEASSVTVEKLNTTFYASALDEEDTFYAMTVPVVTSETVIQGKVTSVSDDEFTVDSGARELTVEIDELGYDPLDDEGYQKIEVGDLVSVAGAIDDDFFEGRELVADSVVELVD